MQARRIGLVVLAAALVAGCGGSSRLSQADYQQKLQADGKAVSAAVAKISGNPSSLSELATEVDAAESAVTKAADDLDKAKPPTNADADNAKIVTALRYIATQLEKLKKAAASGNPTAAQAAASAIRNAPEIKAAQAAIVDLKKKGYKVGAIGS